MRLIDRARLLVTGDHNETLASEKTIAAEEPQPMTPAEIVKAVRCTIDPWS